MITEFGKLITEEPAMDEHEELSKINKEERDARYGDTDEGLEWLHDAALGRDSEVWETQAEEQTVFPFAEEVPFAPKDEGVPDKEVSVDYTELQDIQSSTISAPTMREAAAVVTFHTGVWNNQRRDLKATAQIRQANGLATEGVFGGKILLPNCKSFLEAKRLSGLARNTYYRATKPWVKGGGAMPNQDIPPFITTMTAIKNDFERAADQFVWVDYDDAVVDEQVRLQGSVDSLFNPDDYPPKDELRKMFYIDFEIQQITPDWRTDVVDEGHEVISDFYKQQHTKLMQGFSKTIMGELSEKLATLSERLAYSGTSSTKNPDYKKWGDPVLNNVVDMIDVLERFNFGGDNTMREVRRQLNQALQGRTLTADMLKTNESLRVTTKQQIDEVLSALPSLDQ